MEDSLYRQMKREQRRQTMIYVFRVLFSLFTIGTILFIFSNSAEVAEVSSGKSITVTNKLNAILEGLNFSFRISEHVVRKLAHLTEYALLGFFLMMTLRVYTKRILTHIFFPLFVGLAVPVMDESIQLFTNGRSGEVRDILIDFTGVLAGIACALFLLLLIRMVFVLHKNHEKL